MKYILILFLFSNSFTSCAQKSETELTLNKIIEHAENNSLYRKTVDWSSLKKEMYSLAKDADSVSQLKPALDLMLKELNDTHGRVFHNNQYLSYYTGEKKEHRKNMSSEIYNEIQSIQVYEFKALNLEDDIGYVRIVGLPVGDNQKMSADIQNAVCQVIEKGAKKWIIDLRYNGGGNMFPMVEGITNIIGDGIVGGTKGVTEEESSVWQIKNGDFFYDEQNVAIENKCPISEVQKIAVLTSFYTASSGEALAVILKKRPKTKFFGNKTMGLVTATDYKQIDSLTAMSISVSYYKDRESKVYDNFVDVDEMIEFEPKIELDKDKAINRAIEWLNEKK
ncbi:S41 family peptidase [Maribacter halichondriae]|uniref:S41 family peptidase n=1 Tax=Maribacter halichondriae TaxID=2980554 RepID=UPI0023583644|nr:S41 family peptidase [Maribacter sp. Hal144]